MFLTWLFLFVSAALIWQSCAFCWDHQYSSIFPPHVNPCQLFHFCSSYTFHSSEFSWLRQHSINILRAGIVSTFLLLWFALCCEGSVPGAGKPLSPELLGACALAKAASGSFPKFPFCLKPFLCFCCRFLEVSLWICSMRISPGLACPLRGNVCSLTINTRCAYGHLATQGGDLNSDL